jgi:GR25 family glycosyltransferase involved in LPS biosynthesis
MNTKAFLTENKVEVIAYYNKNVAGLYDVTLRDFMADLLANFRKITTGDDLKKFDLFGNMNEAKSRLGLFSAPVSVDYSKPYAESNHAKMVNYYGADKAAQLSRI